MAGSQRMQMRVGAVVIALAVTMIAGEAMAMGVSRGGPAKLPHWFSISRGSAQVARRPLKEFRARSAAEAQGKVGWRLVGLGR